MTIPYKPPTLNESAFNCPSCRAYAKQTWYQGRGHHPNFALTPFPNLAISRCSHCNAAAYWINGQLAFPKPHSAPPPNTDLDQAIKQIYAEAALIRSDSPRGAAALLRLALQMLCKQLGGTGDNINKDIATFVQKGLPVEVQQALDVVRVIGNNAVHPGQIIVDEKTAEIDMLFNLVNVIANRMITQPKEIKNLFGELPNSVQEAIAKRDGATVADS